jgi:dienelactone hydrolase
LQHCDGYGRLLDVTDILASWAPGEHSGASLSGETLNFPTYRKGEGPGVIVIHEIPGLTPKVVAFAEEVVATGYTVVLPHLFGTPGRGLNPLSFASSMRQVCVNREFTKLARGETTPVAGWLRSLARELHSELGGPGVGALGMCFTGGFALAMMVGESTVAPVLCQPSVPFAVSPKHGRDLNLSPEDLTAVKERAAGGCQVLGLQFRNDPMTGRRFDALEDEIGEAFLRVDFPGPPHKHGTVTIDRQQEGVDRVLAFFDEKLH